MNSENQKRAELEEAPAPTTGPEWARGYPVEELQAVAGLFDRVRSLAFGRFTLPREADVAAAIQESRLLRTRDGDAAALFRVCRRPKTWTAHDLRTLELPAGSVFVSALGFREGPEGRAAAGRVVDALLEQVDGRSLWVETLSEDRAASTILALRGLELAGRRVAAASEILSLWRSPGPGSLPLRPLAAEEATLLELEPAFLPSADLAGVLDEVAAWRAGGGKLAQHYSSYNKRRSWTALALRGFVESDPYFIEKPSEMARSWRTAHPELLEARCQDTRAAQRFPRTLAFARRLPGHLERVRIMGLAAGGELTRHADVTNRDAGVDDGRLARLHIPISSSADCTFNAWDLDGDLLELSMVPGSLCYLDQRKPHRVSNEGAEERLHLVIDVASGPWLRRRLRAAR